MAPRNTYNKTPEQMAAALASEATLGADGGYRWLSSGNVVPKDYVEIAGVTGAALARHQAAYDANTEQVLAAYRASRARYGYSAEERAEIAAAFGPGETVVDVLTGERVQTSSGRDVDQMYPRPRRRS